MDGCSEIHVTLYSSWNPVAGFKVLFSIHSWDRFVAYFYMESTRIEDLHSELFYGPCCDFWVQFSYTRSRQSLGTFIPKLGYEAPASLVLAAPGILCWMSAPLMAKKNNALALGWWDYHLLNRLKGWVNLGQWQIMTALS